jgi:hypothetical protein
MILWNVNASEILSRRHLFGKERGSLGLAAIALPPAPRLAQLFAFLYLSSKIILETRIFVFPLLY